MLKLIKGATIYAPEYLSVMDVIAALLLHSIDSYEAFYCASLLV